MKSLSSYILERSYVKELPFSLDIFTRYIQDVVYDFDIDSPYYTQIHDAIVSVYNEKVFKSFVGWCESINGYHEGPNSGISIEEFYERLKQIPLDRLNRSISAGSSGVVLDADNSVIKLFYGDLKSVPGSCDYEFYKGCLNSSFKTLPQVSRMGRNYVVMEKLDCDNPKIKKLYNAFKEKVNGRTIENWLCVNDGSPLPKFTKEQQKAYDWGQTCLTELHSIGIDLDGCTVMPGDFFPKNLGVRKNGDIVWFDI